MANASGDLAIDFLEGVTTLLDQNLLKSLDRRDGEARLGMLETIASTGWNSWRLPAKCANSP